MGRLRNQYLYTGNHKHEKLFDGNLSSPSCPHFICPSPSCPLLYYFVGDHHIWSSCMIIIYDHHVWWSYMMIMYDDHIWWSCIYFLQYPAMVTKRVWYSHTSTSTKLERKMRAQWFDAASAQGSKERRAQQNQCRKRAELGRKTRTKTENRPKTLDKSLDYSPRDLWKFAIVSAEVLEFSSIVFVRPCIVAFLYRK
jgi:hypothetical protein